MKLIRVDSRFVYNRKKKLNSEGKALVQQEIRIGQKKKYYSTGIYLTPNQWRGKVVNHQHEYSLNRKLQKRLAEIVQLNPTSFGEIEAHFSGEDPASFIEYFENFIENHHCKYSTYKQYRSALNHLRRFGGIQTLGDLTSENIQKFSDYMRSHGLSEQTIYNLHKRYKTAVNRLKIENPYKELRMSPGKDSVIRYLTSDELRKLEAWMPDSEKLSRTKDLFLFSCYTGLSYSDVTNFKVTEEGGEKWIIDRREKSGEGFKIYLTNKALALLDKGLTIPCNQVVNRHLKEISYKAGIKDVTFHMARHTFAVYMLNEKKAPLEVVAEILGHASIKTTQKYAKVLKDSIRLYMKD